MTINAFDSESRMLVGGRLVEALGGKNFPVINGRLTRAREYRQAASFAAAVLPGMGHNHNIAATRRQLWEDLRRWAEATPTSIRQ